MEEKLKMYTDGSCRDNPGRRGIGIVILKDEKVIRKISKDVGFGTSNEAEYIALIEGLETLMEYNPETVDIYLDSQIVVHHVNGVNKVSSYNLRPFYNKVKKVMKSMKDTTISINWIPREQNVLADKLANSATTGEGYVIVNGKESYWSPKDFDINPNAAMRIKGMPSISGNCRDNINELNRNMVFSRKNFKKLSTYGEDGYTHLTKEELLDVVERSFGIETMNWTLTMLEGYSSNFTLDVIRWTARGLYPNLSFRKVLVDKDIMKNKKENYSIEALIDEDLYHLLEEYRLIEMFEKGKKEEFLAHVEMFLAFHAELKKE